jgi:hypothetical protein
MEDEMLVRFRPIFSLLIGLALLTALVPAAAQDADLSETYSFEDGTAFSYSADWNLDKKPTYLKIASEETEIFIVTPEAIEEGGYSADNPSDLLQVYFEDIFGGSLDFDADNVQEFEVGGREAARYDYVDGNDSEALLIALRFNDQSFGIIDSVSKIGDLTEEDMVLAVAESFNRGEGASDSRAVDAEPCTVSTASQGTVAIRVGPGTNRTSYAFLPANQDFVVMGQGEADDGSLWWKLDKEEAAPGKSAAEAWVSQDDVDAIGGCSEVVDAFAPPVIPIVSAPPTNSGSGDSGSGTTDPGAQPPGAGDIIPQGGTWTVVYARTASISCLDLPPQNAEIDLPSDTLSLSVRDGGASLSFGGDIYTRTQPNTYVGFFDAPGFGSVRQTLRVISATQMSGEFTLNMSDNGRQCSGTIYSTATHN